MMPMYFVQHGIALDKAVNADRPLSESGQAGVLKIAQQLSRQGIQIKKIYHSGKTRARQTAELFATALEIADVDSRNLLNPNDDVRQLASQLEQDCLYVGHLPQLEKLVSLLVSGNEQLAVVRYENAAVVCIEPNAEGYYIDWMLKPSMLG